MRIPSGPGTQATAMAVSLPPLSSGVPSQPQIPQHSSVRRDPSSLSLRRTRTPPANAQPSPHSFSSYNNNSSNNNTTAGNSTTTADPSRSRLDNGSVRVVARCRPMNANELARGDVQLFRFAPKVTHEMQVVSTASGASRELVRSYQFDYCASEELSQSHFFRASGAMALIDSVVQGYLATIFAYGQTGSGKTYSMSGVDELLATNAPAAHKRTAVAAALSPTRPNDIDASDGIIPRALKYLFRVIATAPSDVTFLVRASCCEIYNEQVFDLLNPASGALNVRSNDRSSSGFYVQSLLVVQCDTIDDVLAVVHEAHRNRRVGTHAMNKDSSRSHSILTVHVDRQTTDPSDNHVVTKFGKVSFVDLAGSERLKETKSSNTEETSNINKSLLTLGKVISALASKASANFIPYRDSKLTKLLMDSLGGSSLTLMVACVSPSAAALDDTLSTLNYATRAKNIQNKPTVQVDPTEFALSSLRQENHALRAENEALRLQLRALGQRASPLKTTALASSSSDLAHSQTSMLTTVARSPSLASIPSASQLPGVSESSLLVLPPIHSNHLGRSPSKDRRHPQQHRHYSAADSDNNTRDAHTNQLRTLQDENDRLVQRSSAAEQTAQQLRIANQALERQLAQIVADTTSATESSRRHPVASTSPSKTNAAALRQDNVAGSPTKTAAVDQLRLQVRQLQQREQELMQALARRSRGNRDIHS